MSFDTVAYNRAYYRAHRQRILERTRAYAKRNREKRREYARVEWEKNGHKQLVRRLASTALRWGLLKREPCRVCGKAAEMHHPDYAKPLDVVWLCKDHHEEVHHGKI